jgi:hypothetical protein
MPRFFACSATGISRRIGEAGTACPRVEIFGITSGRL